MRALFRFDDIVVSDHVVLDTEDRRLRYGMRGDRPVVVEYLAKKPPMQVYAWQSLCFEAVIRVTTSTASAYDVDGAPVVVSEPAPSLFLSRVLERLSEEAGRPPAELVAAVGLAGVEAINLFNSVEDDRFGTMRSADVASMITVSLEGRLWARPRFALKTRSLTREVLWLPPEQLRNPEPGRPSTADVYQLGLLLFSLCFGRLPYETVKDLVGGHPISVAAKNPLEQLAIACTQPAPASRPTLAHVVGVLREHEGEQVDVAGFLRGVAPDDWRALELVTEELQLLSRDCPAIAAQPLELAPFREALRHPPPEGLAWPVSPDTSLRELP